MESGKRNDEKKVQKRASLEPSILLEGQLLLDADSLLEANYENPVVPLQALWLLIITC